MQNSSRSSKQSIAPIVNEAAAAKSSARANRGCASNSPRLDTIVDAPIRLKHAATRRDAIQVVAGLRNVSRGFSPAQIAIGTRVTTTFRVTIHSLRSMKRKMTSVMIKAQLVSKPKHSITTVHVIQSEQGHTSEWLPDHVKSVMFLTSIEVSVYFTIRLRPHQLNSITSGHFSSS